MRSSAHTTHSRRLTRSRPSRAPGSAPWSIFFARVVQCRDIRLRSGPVQVQVLPRVPISAPVAQLGEAAGLNPAQCWCKSGREHFFRPRSPTQRHPPQIRNSASASLAAGTNGTRSGQARRGFLLRKSCRVSGMGSMPSAFRHFLCISTADSLSDARLHLIGAPFQFTLIAPHPPSYLTRSSL